MERVVIGGSLSRCISRPTESPGRGRGASQSLLRCCYIEHYCQHHHSSLSLLLTITMPSLTGATRLAFLAFFASHIPITLLMNGQTVLPEALFPNVLRGILPFYAAQFNDTLMTAPFDTWFQSFVVCEVLLQVPFFIYAVMALLNWQSTNGSKWFRTACLVYGSHAVTTLIPILAETIFNKKNTAAEKCVLVSLYLPYLCFPAWLVYIAATNDDVFSESVSPIKAKVV